jgi:hypothetical protein
MTTNTTTLTGSFTSTGNNISIPLRSGVNWMSVWNYTQIGTNQTTALGVSYYWQTGMPQGGGLVHLKSEAADAANLDQTLASGGFTYIDSSLVSYGAINATTTAISTATIPVVTNTGTNGIVAGQTVRILNQAGSPQFGGIDFTVGQNTLSATTFSLDYAPTLSVAGTAGSWMLVNSSPLYYPSSRIITKMVSSGSSTVITMSVTHTYQVGQDIRLNIVDSAYGQWTILNGQYGTITAISNSATVNSITVNINSSALSSFAFPLAAAVPFTPAQVIPFGENTAEAESLGLNILSDATYNTGYIGMILGGGAGYPGGDTSDLMYWAAGTSFSNNGM